MSSPEEMGFEIAQERNINEELGSIVSLVDDYIDLYSKYAFLSANMMRRASTPEELIKDLDKNKEFNKEHAFKLKEGLSQLRGIINGFETKFDQKLDFITEVIDASERYLEAEDWFNVAKELQSLKDRMYAMGRMAIIISPESKQIFESIPVHGMGDRNVWEKIAN